MCFEIKKNKLKTIGIQHNVSQEQIILVKASSFLSALIFLACSCVE